MCSSGFANAQADKHLFCQHPMLLFYMRHISITVDKKHVSEEKSTSPYTLIFHYHLNLVLKCCHCIATVLCFVYLAILYCTVLYLYLFICSWAIMALCINKVSYRKVSYHEKILPETTRPRALIIGIYHHLVDFYRLFNLCPWAKKGPAAGVT